MKSMFLLIAGGALFTGVFVGGVILGAVGMYAISKDDIQAGMKAKASHSSILKTASMMAEIPHMDGAEA